MSFNKSSADAFGGKQDPERIASAIKFFRQGRKAQAFLILSAAGTDKDPVARFALGLCHFHAGDLPMAISCFEQALQLLKVMPARPQGSAENTDAYLKLAVAQIEDKNYLSPIDADFCMFFPKASEQIVILALIEAYLQMGMLEKAQQLSLGLTGPVYEEYKKKLM
jgi:tetratricopeptide (TPR) repeat protein